jgi:hypothetical protein
MVKVRADPILWTPRKRDTAPGVIHGRESARSARSSGQSGQALPSEGKTIGKVAWELNLGETALMRWLDQAKVDVGEAPPRF